MKVAFDCDGTLLDYDNNLRDDMCRLLIAFIFAGAEVTVWSGGGKQYAQNVWHKVIHKYELMDTMSDLIENVQCKMKDGSKPDLTFDDQPVNLGVVNVCMPPLVDIYE